MHTYFRFMAGSTGRILRGCTGFALLAGGYSFYQYPLNIILATAGVVLLLAALWNILLLAPLFGYPVRGAKIAAVYGPVEELPGEDKSAPPETEDSATGRTAALGAKKEDGDKAAAFATGSATQGGSNFGQGSSHLSGKSYKQGSIKNTGSSYENEKGQFRDDQAGD